MDPAIELGWIGQVGGWAGMVGLTALLWYMLATGKLYTRSQHDSIVLLHKEAAVKDEKIITQLQEQNSALLEGSRTAKDFFEKVPVEEKQPTTRGDQ